MASLMAAKSTTAGTPLNLRSDLRKVLENDTSRLEWYVDLLLGSVLPV
jgi:hypothetical protein